jgi:hypothetical protein
MAGSEEIGMTTVSGVPVSSAEFRPLRDQIIASDPDLFG